MHCRKARMHNGLEAARHGKGTARPKAPGKDEDEW